MLNQRTLVELLFRTIGFIGLFIGVAFSIFGALNYVNLPYYFIADSGNPSSDGSITLLVNGLLWLGLCSILILSGIEFSSSYKTIKKFLSSQYSSISVRFYLLAAFLMLGTILYIVLILMNYIHPTQFFPNILFVDKETLMDFSPIFNALLFFLLITILYRIPYKLIKYGIKIGGLE
ncbi:MAG: hypothetical protein ACTSRS_18010 [Candidatus Helarchaeota archaeon]